VIRSTIEGRSNSANTASTASTASTLTEFHHDPQQAIGARADVRLQVFAYHAR
jgi:hypothetical protein